MQYTNMGVGWILSPKSFSLSPDVIQLWRGKAGQCSLLIKANKVP